MNSLATTNNTQLFSELLTTIQEYCATTYDDFMGHLNQWLHYIKTLFPHVTYFKRVQHRLCQIVFFDNHYIQICRVPSQDAPCFSVELSDLLTTLRCLNLTSSTPEYLSQEIVQNAKQLVSGGCFVDDYGIVNYTLLSECNDVLVTLNNDNKSQLVTKRDTVMTHIRSVVRDMTPVTDIIVDEDRSPKAVPLLTEKASSFDALREQQASQYYQVSTTHLIP